MYTVVIEKRHCEQSDGYKSNTNCPLCVAMKEQYPASGLFHVGGDYVRNKDIVLYFNAGKKTGWNIVRVDQLLSGEITSYTLLIPTNNEEQEQQSEYVDITKSLAVLPVQETTDTKTDDLINEEIPEDYYLKY